MKSTLLLLFTCSLIASYARKSEDLRLLPTFYTIVSDEKDDNIRKGHFILTGHVKMYSSTNPIEDAQIGCTSSGTWTRSKKDGGFEIELNITDSVVYFYKEGWTEVVIEDYDFKEQHRIDLDVYMAQEKQPQLMRKPLIYLYSDKNLSATVKVDPNGQFSFTYPQYPYEGWKVDISPANQLSVDGKSYPYLFWEAESHQMNFKIKNGKLEGFLVPRTEVVTFLEDKLNQLGLNNKEQTDFITYWGPILTKKKFALIQFFVDEDYEKRIASIDIDPKPDNMRRIYIMCSTLEDNHIGIDVIPQELISFDRNGFTVVEWGGSVIDIENLQP